MHRESYTQSGSSGAQCSMQAEECEFALYRYTTRVIASGCTVPAAAMISLAFVLQAFKHQPYNIDDRELHVVVDDRHLHMSSFLWACLSK